jgi:hypothetical protein
MDVLCDVLSDVAVFLPPLTPFSALLILTWMDDEVAVAPLLSCAVAATVYIPHGMLDHENEYGLVVELPMTVEFAL